MFEDIFRRSLNPLDQRLPQVASGSQKCSGCDGRGHTGSPCINCQGTGIVSGYMCMVCQGRRFDQCMSCRGTGQR